MGVKLDQSSELDTSRWCKNPNTSFIFFFQNCPRDWLVIDLLRLIVVIIIITVGTYRPFPLSLSLPPLFLQCLPITWP